MYLVAHRAHELWVEVSVLLSRRVDPSLHRSQYLSFYAAALCRRTVARVIDQTACPRACLWPNPSAVTDDGVSLGSSSVTATSLSVFVCDLLLHAVRPLKSYSAVRSIRLPHRLPDPCPCAHYIAPWIAFSFPYSSPWHADSPQPYLPTAVHLPRLSPSASPKVLLPHLLPE